MHDPAQKVRPKRMLIAMGIIALGCALFVHFVFWAVIVVYIEHLRP